jgi:hypothetical protein
MKREPWRTWKKPDILRVKALEEYFLAKREQALSEQDIAKAFRYTDRYTAIYSRGTSIVMGTVSSAR